MACARLRHMLLQVSGSLPPASPSARAVSFDTTAPDIFLASRVMPRRMAHVRNGFFVRAPGRDQVPRGPAACAFCWGHARMHMSARDGQLHRRTDWAGHSARKPPGIAAPHPHTPCACVSAKVGVACVQTGPCVPRPLRVPRAPHARSACTDPPIARDECGHWAVFSILIIYISMPGLIPVA